MLQFTTPYYNNDEKKFHYKYNLKTKSQKYLTFLNTLIGLTADWITIAKDMHISLEKKILNLPLATINFQYAHYLYNQAEVNRFLTRNKCKDYDPWIRISLL